MIDPAQPFYAIVVSLAVVPLIALSRSSPNVRECWSLLASITTCLLVGAMIPAVLRGELIEYSLVTVIPGLTLAFRVDELGVLFAATASFLWVVTSVYSIGYLRMLNERHQTRYYSFFAVAVSATLGIAFSANLFTLFLCYELLTLSTYPLVIHQQTVESLKAGRRYLTYLLGTSFAFLLFAIFLTYAAAGTLNFTPGGILAGKASSLLSTVIFVLFIIGTAKAALMPLHAWLPAAMVAPTPVSALLHAVAVVKAGVFTILRIISGIFGADLLGDLGLGGVLAYCAGLTIIVAALIAIRQDSLKLRLAYSTISQLAYMVLGAALLTPSGLAGSMITLAAHAFGKITLFFCAGAIYVVTHKTNISELNGIGRAMPWTMGAFAISSLSMIGFPPFVGFLGKWVLTTGAVEAHRFGLVVVILVGSVMTAAYLLPIVYAAFFKESTTSHAPVRQEAPLLILAPLLVTAGSGVILFFWPTAVIELARAFSLRF